LSRDLLVDRGRVVHHRPEKPDEFTSDGDDRDVGPLPIRQVIEARVQPLLRLPGMRDHGRRLPLLATLEINADLRAMPR
jgi:hypothetical protein